MRNYRNTMESMIPYRPRSYISPTKRKSIGFSKIISQLMASHRLYLQSKMDQYHPTTNQNQYPYLTTNQSNKLLANPSVR